MSAVSATSTRLSRVAPGIDPNAPGSTRSGSPTRRRLAAVKPIWVPAPRFPFITLISMILLGGVVGLLMFNTSMQQSSFAATQLTLEAKSLAQRQQTLQMELQDLRDPQRVAERARALGMVPMTSPGFLRLSDGRFLGHPQPAQPADAIDITEPGFRPPPAAYYRPAAQQPAADASPGAQRNQRNQSADQTAGTTGAGTAAGAANSGDTRKHSRDHGKNRGTN